MASDRLPRRIEHLPVQIEQEADQQIWQVVHDRAHEVIVLAPDNSDAQAFLSAADRRLSSTILRIPPVFNPSDTPLAAQSQHTSFDIATGFHLA